MLPKFYKTLVAWEDLGIRQYPNLGGENRPALTVNSYSIRMTHLTVYSICMDTLPVTPSAQTPR